jgi:hypothetical protein
MGLAAMHGILAEFVGFSQNHFQPRLSDEVMSGAGVSFRRSWGQVRQLREHSVRRCSRHKLHLDHWDTIRLHSDEHRE